jgi:hypothetical protein
LDGHFGKKRWVKNTRMSDGKKGRERGGGGEREKEGLECEVIKVEGKERR